MAWFFTRPSSHSHSHSHRPSYSRSSSSRGSSYYKRRPRDGYISRLIDKFKHLLRELWYYARRNPAKLFFFVIMPLISGGALAAFARQFGIRLPSFLAGKATKELGGGYYGSKGYGGGIGGLSSGLSGLESLAGGGSLGSLMNVAKAFL